MKDLMFYETGSGGDMKINSNDLDLSSLLLQQVYIALFGGNYEASTKGNEINGQLRSDFWANSLLLLDFNSETERILNQVALNASGRLKIRNAVENDLKFLNKVVDYSVEVLIPSINEVKILVYLTEKENQKEKIIQIVFEVAKKEIIIDYII